jgi:predicted RNase H-like nuclease
MLSSPGSLALATASRRIASGANRLLIGVDGAAGGWLAVVLSDGGFHDAVRFFCFAELADRYRDAAAIAVDTPKSVYRIGSPRGQPPRSRIIQTARASIFLVPARRVIGAQTYEQALAVTRALGVQGISRQLYSLRDKILEVDEIPAARPNLVEAHP